MRSLIDTDEARNYSARASDAYPSLPVIFLPQSLLLDGRLSIDSALHGARAQATPIFLSRNLYSCLYWRLH